ncbi:MAG: topoisomerase IV [Clostridia bacterium]|nr:topoisomerase IV [Clostridia bacterium]
MAKKKKSAVVTYEEAEATPQLITDTIEKNYMPYVMSVIISRALPEIDGFKPSHRKLLYTMYTMGLLSGPRTKSANVVGQTMRLNPHGDAAIYETLVRMTRGNEALLHPFIDSKGSFGKQYSRDMAYAAARYTEVKLDSFCAELFSGIDKDAVDMVPNYDNTTTEPTLLPTTFPNILVSSNLGIAVGMACNICSFNLAEVCDGTIALLKNPKLSVDKMMDYIKGPDFPGGATMLYNREQLREIYSTGVGSITLRARYQYDPVQNCIDILQIPYSSCIENILKKIGELVKNGKIKDIVDYRDAIDLNGFRLSLDLKKGASADKIMDMLYVMTDLQKNFDCNFNILVNGTPRQMGVIDILNAWIDFRIGCLRRELAYDLEKKRAKLHLLLGLSAILLDIDKAIAIIRSTPNEADVVPNLMKGFDLSEIQAEHIAEIKLRHLNREYITNRIKELENIQKEIEHLESVLADELKIKELIIEQLKEIKKKYGKPRKTQIMNAEEVRVLEKEDFIENYKVRLVTTKHGYFKKITAQSLRGNDEQKLKEGDYVIFEEDADNVKDLFVLTNKAQAYRYKLSDIEVSKASSLGEYLPSVLGMDEGEVPLFCKAITDINPNHQVAVFFENGKAARFSMGVYATKGNRRKTVGAYSKRAVAIGAFYVEDEKQKVVLRSDAKKALCVAFKDISFTQARDAQGNTVFSLKPAKSKVIAAEPTQFYEMPEHYHKRTPSMGSAITPKDVQALEKRGIVL